MLAGRCLRVKHKSHAIGSDGAGVTLRTDH